MQSFRQYISFVLSASLLTVAPSTIAQSLNIATWNMEWLSSTPVDTIHQSRRSNIDITGYRASFTQVAPDILAFQEVNDANAIQAIVGSDYQIVLSDRANRGHAELQFHDINQYTGFAIKRGTRFSDPVDLELTKGSKLRFASYIIINPNKSDELHLLSIHLKAGCIGKFYSGKRSCETLSQQADVLADWMNSRTNSNQAYMIIGDFNHGLSYPNDWMWQKMTNRLMAKPILATQEVEPNCIGHGKSKPYRQLIDHIVVSNDVKFRQAKQWLYTPQQRSLKLSDHCPVSVIIE